MKKTFSVFVILMSLMLYGYNTSAYGTAIFHKTENNTELSFTAEHQYYFSSSSGTNDQIEKNEILNSIYTNTPVTSLNNPFFKLLAFSSAIEHSFFCTYTQYKFYSLSLLIKLQQVRITFPFHNFW